MLQRLIYVITVCLLHLVCFAQQKTYTTQVAIIGAGAGGTAAAIAAARQGAKVILIEPTSWLGGMLTAAGVAATDGNHNLPSGLWEEFRQYLYKVYGSAKAIETGWVSNTHFEPRVGDAIFKTMVAKERNIEVLYNCKLQKVLKQKQKIIALIVEDNNRQTIEIKADVFVDGTETGELLAKAKFKFDVGMEKSSKTLEPINIKKSNKIVQDITYVAILKDFGAGKDMTIARPANYDSLEFDGACSSFYIDTTRKKPSVDALKMLQYAKLPNNKYMLNWPNYGNDTYIDFIGKSEEKQHALFEKAKQTTLRFIYFIQKQLGYKNLGLADDEFPTADKLALMPYIREGRRARALTRLQLQHILSPYNFELYKTGISVGDYPIDHHHKKNKNFKDDIVFPPVPSYNIPLGCLIPQKAENLLIADKAIGVSNIVNGTTRLQPVVMLTGQAAGTLAGLSAKQNVQPAQVQVRAVQKALLSQKAFLMPFIDVKPTHDYFEAVQRIAACGILKGKGVPYKWANQTWFYPDSLMSAKDLSSELSTFYNKPFISNSEFVVEDDLVNYCLQVDTTLNSSTVKNTIKEMLGQRLLANQPLKRSEVALIIDKFLNPFTHQLNHYGLKQ
jgi:hypothetical protein